MKFSVFFKGSTPSELLSSLIIPLALPVVIDVLSLRDNEKRCIIEYNHDITKLHHFEAACLNPTLRTSD